MERKTNSNITRIKSGNITNTEIVSTTSYEKGLSWGSFKIIFLVCLLTIFSCIFFVGDMPTGFKNSIKQETIKTLVGYEKETITDLDEFYTALNPLNIKDYKFKLKKSFEYYPVHSITDYNYDLINFQNIKPVDLPLVDINYSDIPNVDFQYLTSLAYSSQDCPISLNGFNFQSGRYIYFAGFVIRVGNNSTGYSNPLVYYNKYNYSQPFIAYTDSVAYNSVDIYFTFNETYSNYYNLNYGNDYSYFQPLKYFLMCGFEPIIDSDILVPVFSEYNLNYSDYNWTGIKIHQLSYFKNIFVPLFNQENQDITNNISLNNGFDYLETLIAKNLISYTGDKITPNRAWGDNWSINDDEFTINQKYKFAKFMGSNVGYFINSNYYYDDITKTFSRYNTNQLYGSLENDNNTSWQNLLNVLSYPLTTSYNILYNIGVFFTFIFYW